MKASYVFRLIPLFACIALTGLSGQVTPPPASAAAGSARPDSTNSSFHRAGWLSDRRALRVGDLITVVVNEQTVASERISTRALNDRSQDAGLDNAYVPEKLTSFGIGYRASSDNTGQSDRRGNFTAMLSVRVTAIEPGGIARISGQKKVIIDGRLQAVTLSGVVRPDDIGNGNTIVSSRIAEAEISYQGKKINPKTGLFGKILGALWP